jgi:hypothetical protein
VQGAMDRAVDLRDDASAPASAARRIAGGLVI